MIDIQELKRLYNPALTLLANARIISEKVPISKETCYYMLRIQKKGFASVNDYQTHLIKRRVNPETKRLFASRAEYKLFLTKRKINPKTKRKFKSASEYNDYLARQRVNPETGKRFKSYCELRDYRARQRVNPETMEPFSSDAELDNYRIRRRVNPETMEPFESTTQYQEYKLQKQFNKKRFCPLPKAIKRKTCLDNDIERKELCNLLYPLLEFLPERVRYILTQRYFSNKTHEKLGKGLGIAKQRVGQIELAALRKLLPRAKQVGLEDFLKL